jgi:hypothetical protein
MFMAMNRSRLSRLRVALGIIAIVCILGPVLLDYLSYESVYGGSHTPWLDIYWNNFSLPLLILGPLVGVVIAGAVLFDSRKNTGSSGKRISLVAIIIFSLITIAFIYFLFAWGHCNWPGSSCQSWGID